MRIAPSDGARLAHSNKGRAAGGDTSSIRLVQEGPDWRLIWREVLHAVDDEHLDWTGLRLQLQAELLLKRGEE